MRWVILISIFALEATIVLLLIQVLARVWVWIRWPVWIVLIGAATIVTAAVCDSWNGDSSISSGDWNSHQDLFNLHAPFPTYRLLLFSSLAAIPVLLFGLGMASFLRTKDGRLRILVWGISWKSSLLALASAFAFLVAVLVVNDVRLCRQIRAMDEESRQLARRVEPPSCPDEQNAAAFYQAVPRLGERWQDKDLPDPAEDLQVLRSESWSAYLASHADLAERIRAASKLPRCRFNIDWSDPNPVADCPEFDGVRDCIRLLFRQGHRALLDGDIDLGFENALALRRISEQVGEDPRITAQQSSYTADGLAVDLVEHLLHLHRPTAEEVSRFVRPGVEFLSRAPDCCTRQQAEFYRMVAMKYFGQVVDPGDDELPGFRFLLNAILVRDRLLGAGDDLRALPAIFAEIRCRYEVPYGQPAGGSNLALWFYAYRQGGASITGLVDSSVFSPLSRSASADMRRRLADFAMRVAQQGLVEECWKKAPTPYCPLLIAPSTSTTTNRFESSWPTAES